MFVDRLVVVSVVCCVVQYFISFLKNHDGGDVVFCCCCCCCCCSPVQYCFDGSTVGSTGMSALHMGVPVRQAPSQSMHRRKQQ